MNEAQPSRPEASQEAAVVPSRNAIRITAEDIGPAHPMPAAHAAVGSGPIESPVDTERAPLPAAAITRTVAPVEAPAEAPAATQEDEGPDEGLTDGVDERAAGTDNSRAEEKSASSLPELGCLTRTICAIKQKIRWQTPAWTPAQCQKVASAVLAASKKHDISPTLLLGVMINESDLNEKATRVSMHGNKVYAKDSGLMAVRCVLDRRNRCLNGNVRGMSWSELMSPATNISVGARELAYWKNGGAVTRVVVKVRDARGRIRPMYKTTPCRHKDHGYWAHYNHGPVYINHGNPRHYPHRVAVLDHALAAVLNLDPPELHGSHITMRDVGKRQRTADHPIEARYRKLCSQIQSVGACSTVALND